LEKTSKIIKANHQPNTTMAAKPCPEVISGSGLVVPFLPLHLADLHPEDTISGI